MLIFIFTVLVMSMALLIMYNKEKHALRRMLARGRCGLPGMPNESFNKALDVYNDECGDNEDDKNKMKDPFDSQLKTLTKIIIEKRKQITDSKGRVIKAEDILKNLHVNSITLRRRYQAIMDELREEIASAEDECEVLNKYVGKANMMKQKFFSTDDNDECAENRGLPSVPKRVTEEQWGELPLCADSPKKQPSNTSNTCHPPIQRPCGPGGVPPPPFSCKCPSNTSNLSTCIPPRPSCCPKKSSDSCSTQSSQSLSVEQNQYQGNSGGGCCGQSNSDSQPCPPPLPSLMLGQSPSRDSNGKNNLSSRQPKSSFLGSSCCGSSAPLTPPAPNCTPSPPNCVPCGQSSPASPFRNVPLTRATHLTPRNSSSSCPCDCLDEPPKPRPKFVKKPPFSSFLQERMAAQPIQRRSFKQTVVTEECIEDEEENSSWLEPGTGTFTEVTKVTTSSVTFPPNCCVSTYEEFLTSAPPSKPSVKLPVIVDECDPCAEIPREISPWEDIENITHTCGTQTKDVITNQVSIDSLSIRNAPPPHPPSPSRRRSCQ